MKKMQKGFSLVELMVVIAIIAILAAVAVPMYSNYTTRAKIGTALTSVGGLKNDVSEAMMNSGGTVTASANSGSAATFNGSITPSSSTGGISYTTTVAATGVITIALTAPVQGNILLTPTYVAGAGSMTWTCSANGTATSGSAGALTASQIPSPCTFS
jgi:type IV pilus assembly protein PilA